MARHTIIGLMPEPLRDILFAQILCESFRDIQDWQTWAVDELIDHADKRPGPEMGDFPGAVRAMCPLCGSEAQTPYSRGFSVPTGLTRHLEGSHKVGRCPVFEAAAEMAFERERERAAGKPQLTHGTQHVPPWKVPKPEPLALPSAAVHEFKPRDR